MTLYLWPVAFVYLFVWFFVFLFALVLGKFWGFGSFGPGSSPGVALAAWGWAGQCVQTSPASKDKRGKDVDGRSRLLVGTNNILFLPSTGLPVRKDILRAEDNVYRKVKK